MTTPTDRLFDVIVVWIKSENLTRQEATNVLNEAADLADDWVFENFKPEPEFPASPSGFEIEALCDADD